MEYEDLYENLIFDTFESVEGVGLKGYTNFDKDSMMLIYDIMKEDLLIPSRGPKSSLSNLDGITLLLHQMKYGTDYNEIYKNLRLAGLTDKQVTANKIAIKIKKIATQGVDSLVDHFIKLTPYENQKKHFEGRFESVLCIGDTTVFPNLNPSVHFETAKPWFSGKHHFYCTKFESLNNALGEYNQLRAVIGFAHFEPTSKCANPITG